MNLRIGSGIDFHQLVEGRDLWIGGILIPHHKGALGHSDADVLLHAICDALLGALCLGDIGTHFPDTDNAFRWRTAAGGYSSSPQDINTSTNGSHNHTFTTASTGSGNAFVIMNPYITLNYIIKY